MNKTAKISCGQLQTLLLICRIFTLMTFVPLISDGYSFSARLIAAVISTLIQAVVIVPIILLNKAYHGKTVTSIIAEKSRFWGYAASAAYLVFFLAYSTLAVLNFSRFLRQRFFPEENSILMLFILLAVCVYCAHCGIEGLARSSLIVLAIFLIMLVIISVSSAADFDMVNFYTYGYENNLFSAVIEDIARNSEITAAAFLIKNLKSRCKCGLFGLLASKLALIELVTMLIICVLGDYARLTDYPFMSVGSFSGTNLFQRNDALYLIVWTITSVIAISLFIHISCGLIHELIPALPCGNSAAALIVFAAASAVIIIGKDTSDINIFGVSAAAVIVFTGVIPLIVYLMRGKKKNEKKA